MPYEVFPFTFLRRGFVEYPEYRNAVHEQSAGRRVLQKLHAASELVVSGKILFPNAGGTYSAFEAFWRARSGGFGVFLYQPQDAGAKDQVDVFSAAAAETDFTATRRYVDATTLVVRVNTVVQTLGFDYLVENESGGAYVLGTSTKLVVAMTSAPGAGAAVQLEYEYYVPVRFEGDDLPSDQELETGGTSGAWLADRTISVRLREAGPGWSYAAVPNAL